MWIEPTSYSAAKLVTTDSCARRNATTPMGTEMIVRVVSVMRLLLLVRLKGLRSSDGDPATNRRWNRRHESGLSGRLLLLYPEEKNMRILITLATAVTIVATVAFAKMTPTKTGDSAKGKVLTNDKGMTLY